MPLPQQDLDLPAIARHPLAAGLVGALVGLRFAPGTNWVERLSNVASGACIAGYLGPAAAELLELRSPSLQSMLGFALGLFGISVAAAVAQALRDMRLGDIISGWISRR